ncbi:MAG TPA: ABC transporter permease [Bacillales bacterium]|nr:ABC transporter permease [Bacillales bacterium]
MRIKAVFIRILKQFFHDKRTLALLIIAPLLVLTLLSLVFNGGTYEPKIGLVDLPQPMETAFHKQSNADYEKVSLEKGKRKLRNQELDAYLTFQDGKPSLTLEGSDPSINHLVLRAVQEVMMKPHGLSQGKIDVHYLHGGKDLTSFDNFGPVFIGFFAFFFVFLIAGVSFLRERTTGTLERLLASPLRRWEVVAGYILGFGFFTLLQSVILVLFAVYVLNMLMAGSIFYVLFLTMLTAFSALSLGTLLSAFADNELQMIQFIPIVIVPQFFFCGIFNLDTISDWISWIGPLTPLYYVADGLRDVMIRGYGWSDIAIDVYVLLGFSFAFMFLNVLALKKHRRV